MERFDLKQEPRKAHPRLAVPEDGKRGQPYSGARPTAFGGSQGRGRRIRPASIRSILVRRSSRPLRACGSTSDTGFHGKVAVGSSRPGLVMTAKECGEFARKPRKATKPAQFQ